MEISQESRTPKTAIPVGQTCPKTPKTGGAISQTCPEPQKLQFPWARPAQNPQTWDESDAGMNPEGWGHLCPQHGGPGVAQAAPARGSGCPHGGVGPRGGLQVTGWFPCRTGGPPAPLPGQWLRALRGVRGEGRGGGRVLSHAGRVSTQKTPKNGTKGVQGHPEGIEDHRKGIQDHQKGLQGHQKGMQGHSKGIQGHPKGMQGHPKGIQGPPGDFWGEETLPQSCRLIPAPTGCAPAPSPGILPTQGWCGTP